MNDNSGDDQKTIVRAFVSAWGRKREFDDPDIAIKEQQAANVMFTLSLYDPFSGTTKADIEFEWSQIMSALASPDVLADLISDGASAIEEASLDHASRNGDAELLVDADGRVHSTQDVDD